MGGPAWGAIIALITEVDDVAEGSGAAAIHDRICRESSCELLLYLRGGVGQRWVSPKKRAVVPGTRVRRWTTGR